MRDEPFSHFSRIHFEGVTISRGEDGHWVEGEVELAVRAAATKPRLGSLAMLLGKDSRWVWKMQQGSKR